MEEIIKFLEENKYGSLATCSNGQPYARPFEYGFKTQEGIFFYTSNDKEVYNQIQENPKVCFCATDKGFTYVQLTGEAKFIEDQKLKEMMLKHSENARTIYKTADNPEFKVFCMNGKAVMHKYEKGYVCDTQF